MMDQYEPSFDSNDELVNSMVERNYIHYKDLEKIFRCVDRAFYFEKEDVKYNAYCNSVWHSFFALSPPRILASVLENLNLQKGHKFLCIGSGIGYLNTVAGLLLDVNGVNHCIEICQLKIDHALGRLEEFKLNAAAIDYYNFCEPVFICGNACDLLSTGYYDRVFCGADVPPAELEFLKSLINIGGKIVIPFENTLLSFTRKDEYTWQVFALKQQSFYFADLVLPPRYSFDAVKFRSTDKPLRLRELCRFRIRSQLRKNIEKQFPDLSIATKLSSKCFVKNDTDSDKPFRISNSPPVYFRDMVDEQEALLLLRNDTDAVIDDSAIEGDENVLSCSEYFPILGKRHVTLSEKPDESTKRKFSKAGSPEKNSTFTEEENAKNMKTDLVKCEFINERKKNKLSILLKKYIDFLPISENLKNFLNYYKSE